MTLVASVTIETILISSEYRDEHFMLSLRQYNSEMRYDIAFVISEDIREFSSLSLRS